MLSNSPIPLPAPGIKTQDDKIHPAVNTISLPYENHFFVVVGGGFFLLLRLRNRDQSAHGSAACGVGSVVQLMWVIPYGLNQLESPFLGIWLNFGICVPGHS